MKTTRNILMCSCIFCYFAGLWIIASRFGIVKVFTKYNLSEAIDKIPENFPNIEYLYYGLAGYTFLFKIVTYIIYNVASQAGKEQDELQQQSCEVNNYAEKVNTLLSSYIRQAKSNNITDKTAEQKLKHIQRQVASLSPNVIKNATMKSSLANIITELQDILTAEFDYSRFCSTLDSAIDTIDSIKHKSITIH